MIVSDEVVLLCRTSHDQTDRRQTHTSEIENPPFILLGFAGGHS